jgi:threonyl-tRNA synthetase
LWLAPTQVAIVPVSQNYIEYANSVSNELKKAGIRYEVDERNEKIGYKIRDWEMRKVSYMLVVGEKEKEANAVSVRKHKEGDQGSLALSVFIDKIASEIKSKV